MSAFPCNAPTKVVEVTEVNPVIVVSKFTVIVSLKLWFNVKSPPPFKLLPAEIVIVLLLTVGYVGVGTVTVLRLIAVICPSVEEVTLSTAVNVPPNAGASVEVVSVLDTLS